MAVRLNWHAKPAWRKSRVGNWLHGIGPSWSASPARRMVQAGCFGLFLILFFYVAWPHGIGGFSEIRSRKEWVDIELFLALDPLVSFVAAIAARAWVWSLGFALGMIGISLVLPRAFCGYICPMGTLVDLSDWAIGKRIRRFRVQRPGWWRDLRYFVLCAVLAAAACGVVLSGYVAAIPMVTRGIVFILAPVESGLLRGWGSVPQMQGGQWASIGLLVGILLLGLLRPRFWCRHVCPSGAVFSLFNLLRVTERKRQSHCTRCGACAKACSFDAINDDFATAPTNCTFCQTCGGVCPVDAIHFTHRLAAAAPVSVTVRGAGATRLPQTPQVEVSRRSFIFGTTVGAAGGAVAATGLRFTLALPARVLRPPGSVDEGLFVRLCIRCGQCLQVCPSKVLQPLSLEQGFDRLWTPWANANWAGCEPTCNNCGQVCPTGAIQALSLAQKKKTRMGLAEVDANICVQYQGRGECETDGASLLCRDACEAARYAAIVTEGDGHAVPSVRPEQCVGCGLCQAACYRANVIEKHLLKLAAIRVAPGPVASAVRASDSSPSTSTTQPATVDVPYSVPAD